MNKANLNPPLSPLQGVCPSSIMSTSSAGSRNKASFARYVKKAMSPFRVLGKVKELYVRRLMDWSATVSTYGAAGCSNNMGGTVGELPRSFSSRSSSRRGEEYKRRMTELIKATIERMPVKKGEETVPVRSYSVRNMQKINEDEPLEEDHGLKGSKGEKFPRSKSYAQPRKWVGAM